MPDPNVAVRPFGYADPDPVVRRVGNRDLFVGNRAAAESPPRSFAAVVSLTADPSAATTHHRPLVDGPGNTPAEFAAAVDTVRERRGEGPVLVNCRAGVSRSATVAATALAAAEGRGFHEAFGVVAEHRRTAVAHPALCTLAVCYLAAHRQ
ncbi:protein-tyrosine phosphatase family protein [Halosegnis marinus]|uniref:Protein-tyrosine phosphatase family protein n=1 Tax=Halosegnis marinus TaxID=3034023 RepID=A0ABD5ZKJ1_9EURY|nr:protein-tyrosine phosphatase family protein [Halosegnis sp. DT85]